MKTGDVDILPTAPDFVKLESIEDENNIIFLSSGKNSESVYNIFPHWVKCVREKENTAGCEDFKAVYEEKYFRLNDR